MFTRCFLLMTAAFLLAGCATGGAEQNYRELDRDADPFTVDEPAMSEAEPSETLETPGPVDLVVTGEAEPSITDLARDQWEIVVTGPEAAAVTHYPAYYDVLRRRDWTDVLEPAEVEDRLARALAGAYDETWSADAAASALWEPAAFSGHTALLPVKMAFQPPWRRVIWP